jgi:hypothetical protein
LSQKFAQRKRVFLFLAIISTTICVAQKNSVKGYVIDSAENKKLPYCIVALIDKADTTLYQSIRSNEEGKFLFQELSAGEYTLMISYPKMADHLQDIVVTSTTQLDIGIIKLVNQSILMQEVIIRSGVPIRMKGDTLEYLADSFAVRPGANVEELLKRLPGIKVERNGKIIAQGKEVEKVLVEGDEFFSDDPGLATKYLTAEAIDKVQVFDKTSEQTDFTGIDDGTRTKTINLKLKKNRKSGYFGKLEGGSNGKEYYNAEGMAALFNGQRKISLFGNASQLNTNGVSHTEISKYVNSDYETIGDGLDEVRYYDAYDDYGGLYFGGLPSVTTVGTHYSDKWKDGQNKLFSNYRLNRTSNVNTNQTNSTTSLPDGNSFSNSSHSDGENYSLSHKALGSFSFTIDSFSIIKISFTGSKQRSTGHHTTFARSVNELNNLVSSSFQQNEPIATFTVGGTNITWQRKFRNDKQTLSVNFQQDWKKKKNDNYNKAENEFYDPLTGIFINTDTLDQLQAARNNFEAYAGRIVYSYRFNRKVGVLADYGFKNTTALNGMQVFNHRSGKYSEVVDSLSNDYRFGTGTHIGGLSFSVTAGKFNISGGNKLFFTKFNQLNLENGSKTERRFINVGPRMNISLNLPNSIHLTVNYSGSTLQPTIEQLQPLRRTSNALYIQIGNPNLRPAFHQIMSLSFMKFSPANGTKVGATVYAMQTFNQIATASFIDAQNRTASQYVNLDNSNFLGFRTEKDWYLKKLHLRPELRFSANSGRSFYLQNFKKIKNLNLSVDVSSELKYEMNNTVMISYSATFSQSKNWADVADTKTTRNFSHLHRINANVYLPKRFSWGTEFTMSFQPKNEWFPTNQNRFVWNGFVQRSFFKNDKAILKITANDILNNNQGYDRQAYQGNTYESSSLVIKRYVLVSFIYNFLKTV